MQCYNLIREKVEGMVLSCTQPSVEIGLLCTVQSEMYF